MKRFSDFNKAMTSKPVEENCVTSDVNPGNALSTTGVTNHYTPVQNILTNVKNLYACRMSIAASLAEDGFSIKMNSSKFTSEEEIKKYLYTPLDRTTIPLAQYITSQGLDKIKIIKVGDFYVVYFSPKDIKAAEPGLEAPQAEAPVKEMLDYNIEEAEITTITEDEDDEELEDITKKELSKLIDEKDKVKAAKQFMQIVSQQMELPREYYFAGVKDKDGKESIALRWKYTKRRPHKKTAEVTRSLINIYGNDKDGIWVGDFDEKSYFKLPDEVKKLIENILELLGAEKTKDECVYSLGEKDKDEKKEEDKKDDSSKDSDEDVEDDKSRDEDDILSL
ncbi:MAG: hypothetical protein IJ672_06760 [Methanobrevibacter sp.]|nr:hypothetical protein [Methanobrevibacter sp.]